MTTHNKLIVPMMISLGGGGKRSSDSHVSDTFFHIFLTFLIVFGQNKYLRNWSGALYPKIKNYYLIMTSQRNLPKIKFKKKDILKQLFRFLPDFLVEG